MEKRLTLAKKTHKQLSLSRRCKLLGVCRSRVYYRPVVDKEDIELMNLIREIWLMYAFYGYRKITQELRVVYQKNINEKKVLRLMREMQIQAIYPKPNTSKPAKDKTDYPYLLKDLDIDFVNQVWMIDITYLKLHHRFVYLIALIDVFSRYVVGWCLSYTLATEPCLAALEMALKIAKPFIVNSDHGAQFTSEIWTEKLKTLKIKISMTGNGKCHDNIYIERLWRTIKYEAFYLNEFKDFDELKKSLKQFIYFYNNKRYHQSLNYKTPGFIFNK